MSGLTGVSAGRPMTSTQLAITPGTSQISSEVTHLMLGAIEQNTTFLAQSVEETEESYKKDIEEHKATIAVLMEENSRLLKALAESNANFVAQHEVHQQELKMKDETILQVKKIFNVAISEMNARLDALAIRQDQTSLFLDARWMLNDYLSGGGTAAMHYNGYSGTNVSILAQMKEKLDGKYHSWISDPKGIDKLILENKCDILFVKEQLKQLQQD